MPINIEFTVWGMVAFVTLFFVVGLIVTIRAMAAARRERLRAEATGGPPPTLQERWRRYEGPVTPDLARLNPPLRVLVEATCALFGLPGVGWALSARVLPGVVLMIVGPLFVWCLYPVFLSVTGRLASDPYAVVDYLPVLALMSAATLAVFEVRAARRRRHAGVGAAG
ncbi:MAG TPA: hypothetical protein VK576_06105 [Thermoleophilia bacterium]|nr:hypothetical protein [Thermoleophilia bacterium]